LLFIGSVKSLQASMLRPATGNTTYVLPKQSSFVLLVAGQLNPYLLSCPYRA